MKLKEQISINDFDFQNIETDISSLNIKKAVITHYLHNRKNGVKKYFEKDANKYLKEFLSQIESNLYDWEISLKDLETQLALEVENVPFPNDELYTFKFIDLFSGIGGFRIAMQNLGGKCVFSSEWDKYSQITYKANFGEVPFGDITKEETKKHIPNGFDILCAGFPCQAFSIAGRRGGFEDTRGTLFFDVAEILRRHKPKAFFLENVKGFFNHDKGRTLETVLNVLRNDLKYFVPDPQIMNAKNFGVPQNRERVFIVGFREDLKINDFKYPEPTDTTKTFADVKEKDGVPVRYYMSTQYLDTLRKHRARHESKGNGFGYEIIEDDKISNAIVVGGMGRERNLVRDNSLRDFTPETKIKGEVNREGIRRMTPREWARLQGFPEKYIINKVADVHLYKQFGNSVAVPAIQATAQKIIDTLGDKL
ncbi:MAG TPA: DNA cytosine methyltransferase [Pyrinomonadaceae bacterium]|nr:DNA cytosine methyltransferase [Pyrinomonadaceae bacterium]